MKKKILTLTIMIACAAMVATFCGTGYAAVTGVCVNCHTMHNSQGGVEMATFGSETGANDALVRGSCLGCHGQAPGGTGTTAHLINDIPQVLHKGDTNLAGGNFTYIAATGGTTPTTGNTQTAGHNVYYAAIMNETVLTTPPGDEHTTGITNTNFTCAGTTGCHGDRGIAGDFASISGAHHGGVGGLCDTADTVANSYRFLKGVKGHENMDSTYKYQNYNTQYHNEYYGIVAATEAGSATVPGNSTISGLCAECHGNFHGVGNDIGDDIVAPFTRHPTDVVLPNKTEYSAYQLYSVEAPVARVNITTVNTAGVNNVVSPGTDVVMCLSCHGAHATAYEDILRWNYSAMIAGEGEVGTGCFRCHTTKDDA